MNAPLRRRCDFCGSSVERVAGFRHCAACLLGAGMPQPALETVGPYQLWESLDEGGTGQIHLGRHVDEHRFVAIKIAKAEVLSRGEESVKAFRQGLKVQRLVGSHPHVVTTFSVRDSEDGRPYAVMELVEGGSLADVANRAKLRGERAILRFVEKVARAVQFAHDRGVLHCDLKPKNILLNDHDDPVLIDFGHSRILDGAVLEAEVRLWGGTRGWMSPEQAMQAEVTTASDVFALGALLYWLLFDRLPYGSGDDYEQRLLHEAPFDRGLRRRGRSWEVEQVCRRALRTLPEQRYESARALADDLRCVLRGEPIQAEQRSGARRALKWFRRHRVAATASFSSAALLLLSALQVHQVVSDRGIEHDLLLEVADVQADIAGREIETLVQAMERLAREPAVAAATELCDAERDVNQPLPALRDVSDDFDNLSVFSADDVLCARSTKPRRRLGEADVDPAQPRHSPLYYGFRDYLAGLRRGRVPSPYVGRPIESEGDGQIMLSVSAPLVDARGRDLGAVVGHRRSGHTFRNLRTECGAANCVVTVVGLRDRERDEQGRPLPSDLMVLGHPSLRNGEKRMLGDPESARIGHSLRLEGYPTRPVLLEDFPDPTTRVPSLAAAAPIPATSMAVIVSTRPPEAGVLSADWLAVLLAN